MCSHLAIASLRFSVSTVYSQSQPEVVIAPPSLYLLLTREHLGKGFEVAAQNVFDKPNGAFTGEISTEQLQDSGITWVLAGHSERRVILGEDDKVSLGCEDGFCGLDGAGKIQEKGVARKENAI